MKRWAGTSSHRILKAVEEHCFLFFNLYIFFIFGCVGSSLLRAGFLWLQRAGATFLWGCVGFSLQWLLLLQSTGSRRTGFSNCGAWAQ